MGTRFGHTAAGSVAIAVATVLAGTLAGSVPATRSPALQPVAAVRPAPAGQPAAAPSSRPVARDGRFTRPWSLDRGRFRVDPAPAGRVPGHTRDEALRAMRTADDRFWTRAVGLGTSGDAVDLGAAYGLVTLDTPVQPAREGRLPTAPGAGGYRQRPAWVVWYRVTNGIMHCPMLPARPPDVVPPPDAAWQVFVLPDRPGGEVQYTASHLMCQRVYPGTATAALRHLGLAWRQVSRHGGTVTVRYALPACGAESMSSSGGSRRTGYDLSLTGAQPFALAAAICPVPVQRTLAVEVPPGVPLRPGPVGQLPG